MGVDGLVVIADREAAGVADLISCRLVGEGPGLCAGSWWPVLRRAAQREDAAEAIVSAALGVRAPRTVAERPDFVADRACGYGRHGGTRQAASVPVGASVLYFVITVVVGAAIVFGMGVGWARGGLHSDHVTSGYRHGWGVRSVIKLLIVAGGGSTSRCTGGIGMMGVFSVDMRVGHV